VVVAKPNNKNHKAQTVIFSKKNDFIIRMGHDARATIQESLDNKKKPSIVNKTFFLPQFGNNNFKLKDYVPSCKDDLSILEKFDLSAGAKTIAGEENAGGNSVISEVLSYEFLHRAFGAELERTEMQLQYWPAESKKTDYSVKINDQIVGVSVTRAMHYRDDELFTEHDAGLLLKKKLHGINMSSMNIVKRHKWEKQILHIWTRTEKIAQHLERAYRKLKSSYRANTIVLITVAPDCNFLF